MMSNSSGGDPQQPLWCHWVKTCHMLLLGNVVGKNVLHAYQYSSPSTNGMLPSSSSLRVPLEEICPWCSSTRSAYLPWWTGDWTTVSMLSRPSTRSHCDRSPVS